VPFAIVEAVAGHHEPGRLAGECSDTTTAVHIADGLVRECEGAGAQHAPLFDEAHLARVGLLGRLPEWAAMVKKMCEEAGD
jgi:hypothetical protein